MTKEEAREYLVKLLDTEDSEYSIDTFNLSVGEMEDEMEDRFGCECPTREQLGIDSIETKCERFKDCCQYCNLMVLAEIPPNEMPPQNNQSFHFHRDYFQRIGLIKNPNADDLKEEMFKGYVDRHIQL